MTTGSGNDGITSGAPPGWHNLLGEQRAPLPVPAVSIVTGDPTRQEIMGSSGPMRGSASPEPGLDCSILDDRVLAGMSRPWRRPKRPRLSVIVPAFRDGDRIGDNIDRLCAALDRAGISWEVIVVVDGCADTHRFASALRSKRVTVYSFGSNRGKGYALRYGMYKSRGDLLTFIDSDMEIAPEEIGRMAQLLELYEADVVVGSKRHPLSQVQYPRLRRFQSWCYQMLVRVLFRVQVRDTQTGLKLMRREVALRVLRVALVKRFAFDLELLALARHFGYRRIVEAPVRIDYRFSTSTNLGAAFWVLLDTLAVFYRLRLRRWYDRQDARGLVELMSSLPELLDADGASAPERGSDGTGAPAKGFRNGDEGDQEHTAGSAREGAGRR